MIDHATPIAVMLSGSGRTLVNLCERIDAGRVPARIALVIASRECLGAQRARERGIPTVVQTGNIERARLGALLRDHGARWVALAGYLRLLSVPEGFDARIVNIHPALLPAFGGKGMYGDRVHQAVLDHGCKVTGCTVHLCDDRYDTGPILAQATCEVREGDDASSLAARVFALECEVYPETIAALLEGRVEIDGRRSRIFPRDHANQKA